MTKPIQNNDAEFDAFLRHEGQLAIDLRALAEDPPDALTASILQRAQEKLDAEKRAEQSARDEAARCDQLKAQQATLAAANDAQTPDQKAKPARHFLRDWPAMFAIAASLLLVISIGLRWQSASLSTDQRQIALASNTPPIQALNQSASTLEKSASTLEKSANLPNPASLISAESSPNDKAKRAERSNVDTESSAINRITEEKTAQIALSEESRSKKIVDSERLAEQAIRESKTSLPSKPQSIQLSAANSARARDEASLSTEAKAPAPAIVAPPPPAVEAPSAVVADSGRKPYASVAVNSVAERQVETYLPAEPSELTSLKKSAQKTPEIGAVSSTESLKQSNTIAQAASVQKSAEKVEGSAREIDHNKGEIAARHLPAAAPARADGLYAIAPKERLQKIQTLVKQNNSEEALVAWREFHRLFPNYAIPAALKKDLERMEAAKILESSKNKTESDKK
ncbi:MAG: hypothetical protein K2Y28_00220 [Burkholderiaceae bacterium]|nr:hypothetical protein [Burkholderiaceae bacterium]